MLEYQLLLGFDEAGDFNGSFRKKKNAQISDFIKICLVLSRAVPCIRTDIHDSATSRSLSCDLSLVPLGRHHPMISLTCE
jgi:hypothetical protein